MKLEVGNLIYTGFIEAKVRTSMDTLFDEFRFVSANRWAQSEVKGIRLGDDCRILTPDDEQLLDGFVNGLNPSIGGDLTISGQDRTFDLIGSTVGGTGEFKGLTVKQIITQICAPFEIGVSGDADASVSVFRYGLNEMAADVIRELCGRYGFLCNADGSGNVVIEQATTTNRATLQLVEGANIVSGSVTLTENRNSEITMLGQDTSDNASATSTGGADRTRQRTIINGGNLTQGQSTTGAAWSAAISQPESYVVTVDGLYNERANTLIDIKSQSLGVSGTLLIRSILWSMTKRGGHETSFTLVNPAMYGGENTLNDWVA